MQQALSKDIQKLRKLKRHAETLQPEIQIQHDSLKRTFDILFSLTILCLLSPLFIFIALAVRLTSEGPIFFKSRRLGRGGNEIDCWKFRTMYKDAEERLHHLLQTDSAFCAEWEQFQKVKLDPRITPIGRFLRKTSIDEFPQFWNVLRGDLSVVGPRPPTLLGPPDQYFQEICRLYGKRAAKILSVRPGITGIWQISGRSQISFDERCKLEEQYAENRTFWKDLVLIAKTIPAVLFSRGAF
ncbi:MAG TPA: sugar transferase [Chlamydiales bacterium]|nr:sugar transferase [Chlamydiales bacterium]